MLRERYITLYDGWGGLNPRNMVSSNFLTSSFISGLARVTYREVVSRYRNPQLRAGENHS